MSAGVAVFLAGSLLLTGCLVAAEVHSRQRARRATHLEIGVGPGIEHRDPQLKPHQERPRSDSTPNRRAGNAPGATKPPGTGAVYRLKLKETQ